MPAEPGKPVKTLNIIGCGKLGRTLAYLWVKEGVFKPGDVLNRSLESASEAVTFIGAGRPIANIAEMNPADVFMISASDNQIPDCCEALVASGLLQKGNLVFHCSGSIAANQLVDVRKYEALAASAHPLKSFANPQGAAESFPGTFCGVEGQPDALVHLSSAFQKIGGEIFYIDAEQKPVYHAATVIVCNYLTALLEFGIGTFIKSGLSRETARQIMEPIVRGTIDNIFTLGTVQALTGPIARGDFNTVAEQIEALSLRDPAAGELYRQLGSVALELSRQQGTASAESITILANLLENRSD